MFAVGAKRGVPSESGKTRPVRFFPLSWCLRLHPMKKRFAEGGVARSFGTPRYHQTRWIGRPAPHVLALSQSAPSATPIAAPQPG